MSAASDDPRICRGQSERDFLTIMRKMPEERLPAVFRFMRRLKDGEAPRESSILFFMEDGDTREEAEAKVDSARALGLLRAPT